MSTLEHDPLEVPRDGVLRVVVNDIEHDYALDEGDEIELAWEVEQR